MKTKLKRKMGVKKMLSDDFLSQEELDSLLNGLNEESENKDNLDLEKIIDMMSEVGNIAMGSGATTLSTLLRKKVKIESPQASIVKFKDIRTNFEGQQLVITIDYKKGLKGINSFVLPGNMANIISNLMMGGEGKVEENSELDEISKSAVGEAMNQMMGSASTAMSDFLRTSVDISPPNIHVLDFSDESTSFPPMETSEDEDIISIKFNMEINGLAKTIFWQFIPLSFAKTVEELMKKAMSEGDNRTNKNQQQVQNQSPQPQQSQQRQTQQQPQQIADDYSQNSNIINQGSEVNVNPVNFGEISDSSQPQQNTQNIDMNKLQLLLDVPLEIKVELGRVQMSLKEVLDLHNGSMLQLDKLAGEPLDIYANGKLVARGEVVVIEESFGVRITEIVSLKERLRSLK
ncbi:flagellar motor switch phosphatase FliY [Geotoga petraea]|uniref:Flagellar motor switch phosphatase FliY n=2 Tax=Geotoga petraea TaxID=28234 RepID=A0A4Z0VYX8_9BACT|nr:flagellar motor switch protein FliN [Geotoga sp.]TGG89258.1 flagellar motor switch phosphatase FliY [Geotoga petraea]